MSISVKTAQKAMMIQEGAVNPKAIARTLVEAIDEGCEGVGHSEANNAATRLILHQLLFIMGLGDLYELQQTRSYTDDYKAMKEQAQ